MYALWKALGVRREVRQRLCVLDNMISIGNMIIIGVMMLCNGIPVNRVPFMQHRTVQRILNFPRECSPTSVWLLTLVLCCFTSSLPLTFFPTFYQEKIYLQPGETERIVIGNQLKLINIAAVGCFAGSQPECLTFPDFPIVHRDSNFELSSSGGSLLCFTTR